MLPHYLNLLLGRLVFQQRMVVRVPDVEVVEVGRSGHFAESVLFDADSLALFVQQGDT